MNRLIMIAKKALTGILAFAVMATAMPVYSFADEIIVNEEEANLDGNENTYTLCLYTGGGVINEPGWEFGSGTNGEGNPITWYTYTASGEPEITLPTPVLEGEVFDHWRYRDANGKFVKYTKTTYKLNEDLELLVCWKSESDDNIHFLNLFTDGGKISGLGEKWKYEEGINGDGNIYTRYYIYSSEELEITLPTSVVKDGEVFDHWAYTDETTGKYVKYTEKTYKLTKNLSLVARWKSKPTLTLYTAGGEITGLEDGWKYNTWQNSYGNKETEYSYSAFGEPMITLPTPVKEGEEFDHWEYKDETTGKYVKYTETTYKLTKDITLYVRWKSKPTLKLFTGGGVIKGLGPEWEYYEGTNYAGYPITCYSYSASGEPEITLPTPEKEGDVFDHWEYWDDAKDDYVKYKKNTYKLTEDFELVACWKGVPTLSLFTDMGKIPGLGSEWKYWEDINGDGNPISCYEISSSEAPEITLPTSVVKEGEVFDHWEYWDEVQNKYVKYTKTTYKLTEDLALVVRWKEKPTLKLITDGGVINGLGDEWKYYDKIDKSGKFRSWYDFASLEQPEITLPTSVVKEGEEFDYWATFDETTGKYTKFSGSTYKLTETLYLYAVYKKDISVENIIFDHGNSLTVEVGKSEQVNATVVPDDAKEKTVVWTSGNTAVATVTDGLITGVSDGQTTVTAKAGDVSKSIIVTVRESAKDNTEDQDMTDLLDDLGNQKSFDDLVKDVVETTTDTETGETKKETKIWVGGIKSSYTYTGNAIKPEIHVYDGIRELASSDYKVTYNDNKNVGDKGQIKITFKGNYADTPEQILNFTISPANLGSDFTVGDIAATETGKALKISPKVIWNSTGKELKKSFYTVTFKDKNDNVIPSIKNEGTYKAIIEPDDSSVTGIAEAIVTVIPSKDKARDLSKGKIILEYTKTTWTGKELRPNVTVKDSEGKNVSTLNYTVDYMNNINPGQATVMITAIDGNEGSFVGSKSATFKIIKGKSGDNVEITLSDAVYSKAGSKASVRIMDRDTGNVLKEGKDYSLSYSNNKSVTGSAKTAVVKITGKGDYKFIETRYFAIEPQDIAKVTITVEDVTNQAKWNAPKVTVTEEGKKLGKNDYDYKVTTASLPDDGVVTLRVTGKGNYNNYKDITFKVISADKSINKAKTSKDTISKEYTGDRIELSDKELDSLLPELQYGEEYTVSFYSNNIKKGTASVTLSGAGQYGGTKVVKFKIVQKKGNWNNAGKKLVDGKWTD